MCKGFYGRAINLVMRVGKSAQFALILDALRCRNGESNGMDEDHYDAGLSTTFPYLRHDLYYEDTEDMPNFQTDPFGNNSRQLSKLKQQIVIFTDFRREKQLTKDPYSFFLDLFSNQFGLLTRNSNERKH